MTTKTDRQTDRRTESLKIVLIRTTKSDRKGDICYTQREGAMVRHHRGLLADSEATGPEYAQPES